MQSQKIITQTNTDSHTHGIPKRLHTHTHTQTQMLRHISKCINENVWHLMCVSSCRLTFHVHLVTEGEAPGGPVLRCSVEVCNSIRQEPPWLSWFAQWLRSKKSRGQSSWSMVDFCLGKKMCYYFTTRPRCMHGYLALIEGGVSDRSPSCCMGGGCHLSAYRCRHRSLASAWWFVTELSPLCFHPFPVLGVFVVVFSAWIVFCFPRGRLEVWLWDLFADTKPCQFQLMIVFRSMSKTRLMKPEPMKNMKRNEEYIHFSLVTSNCKTLDIFHTFWAGFLWTFSEFKVQSRGPDFKHSL